MKKIFLFVIIILFSASLLNAAEKLYSGALSGAIDGQMIIGDNTTKELTGKISGSWNATMEDDGSITGSASGTFGSINGNNGISGKFEVNYDPKTMMLTGTWTLPGLTTSNTIQFSIDEFTGKFKGPISGTIPTESGGIPFTGNLTLNFEGYPTELTGSINTGLNVKVGWNVLNSYNSQSCGNSYVTDENGKVAGKWEVNILPDQSITGSANGIFKGTATLNLSLSDECIAPELSSLVSSAQGFFTLPPISLSFPYYGTWSGELQGSMQDGLFFGGAWTETYDSANYNSYGEGFENINISNFTPADQSSSKFGGSIVINIDLNNMTDTLIPVNGTIKGGGKTTVNLKELAQEQGICEQYSSLLSQFSADSAIPTAIITLPECAQDGNICNCLPETVEVNWWLDNASINGDMTFQ